MKYALKNLFLSLSILACAFAVAGPSEVRVTQRLADDSGFVGRDLAVPAAGADGLFRFNGSTALPGYVTLGTGLSITSGVLNAAAQVKSDWNATSGLSQIDNKPTISTAAITGQYADLLGKPALATVATTGDYADLINKPATAGVFNFSAPTARTLSVSTAYQATDNAKAAILTISPQCTASITLVTGSTCTMQARIGASGITCSTGTPVATWTNGNTGTLTVGLALNQIVGAPGDIKLPIGGYFILCVTSGTFTINTAVDQAAG